MPQSFLQIYTDSSELTECLCKSWFLKDGSAHCIKNATGKWKICDNVHSRLMIVSLCDDKSIDSEIRRNILAELASFIRNGHDVVVISTFDCTDSNVPWIKVSSIKSAYKAIESLVMLLNGSSLLPIDYNDVQNMLMYPSTRIYLCAEELEQLNISDVERVIADIAKNGKRAIKDLIVQLIYNSDPDITAKLRNFWTHTEQYIDHGIICYSKMPEFPSINVRLNIFYRYD